MTNKSLRKALQLGVAGLAGLVLAECLFAVLAIVAGAVSWKIGSSITGLIALAIAFVALNYFVVEATWEIAEWIQSKMSKDGDVR